MVQLFGEKTAVRASAYVVGERPELEIIWQRLSDEYEIRERQVALDRKLELVSKTASTLVDLLQQSRSHLLEWGIVLLIVFEIGLSLAGKIFD